MTKQNSSTIQKWIEKAREDESVIVSILKHKDASPAIACFHAQQMAEKFLKILLISEKGEIEKIHDLLRLATIIESSVENIFDLENELTLLNKYYIATRYPGDIPEGFSFKDAKEALLAAESIKEFVLAII